MFIDSIPTKIPSSGIFSGMQISMPGDTAEGRTNTLSEIIYIKSSNRVADLSVKKLKELGVIAESSSFTGVSFVNDRVKDLNTLFKLLFNDFLRGCPYAKSYSGGGELDLPAVKLSTRYRESKQVVIHEDPNPLHNRSGSVTSILEIKVSPNLKPVLTRYVKIINKHLVKNGYMLHFYIGSLGESYNPNKSIWVKEVGDFLVLGHRSVKYKVISIKSQPTSENVLRQILLEALGNRMRVTGVPTIPHPNVDNTQLSSVGYEYKVDDSISLLISLQKTLLILPQIKKVLNTIITRNLEYLVTEKTPKLFTRIKTNLAAIPDSY